VWALVNATNADVVATAAAYRAVVMPAFTDLVHTEISNLHQLITHFNHGLQRYTALCQRHTFKKLAPQTGWYKSSCIRNLHACRSVWYRFVWYKFLAHNWTQLYSITKTVRHVTRTVQHDWRASCCCPRNCDEMASNFSWKFLVQVSRACVAGVTLAGCTSTTVS